jgi:hypothetical protein
VRFFLRSVHIQGGPVELAKYNDRHPDWPIAPPCNAFLWHGAHAPHPAARHGNVQLVPELVQYFLYAWSGSSNAKCLQTRHLPIPALSGAIQRQIYSSAWLALARTRCDESTAAHASLRANVLHRRTKPLRGSTRTARAAAVAKIQCVSLTGPWYMDEAIVP